MLTTEQITEIIHLAVQAGDAILEVYRTDSFEVETKSDHSPLTIADKISNDIICCGLKELFPNIPIISEEVKSEPYSQRQSFSYCWLIDPLDGTKEFIKRNGEFTVNIALIKNNAPVFGVIFVPVTHETYYAAIDQGAYKIVDGEHRLLKANEYSLLDENITVVASRSHLNEETQRLLMQLKNPETMSRGSSLKFMMLAEGKADFYPRLAPTMEWDTAAAHIILNESGGSIIDPITGSPLFYNKENLLNPHFMASANRHENIDQMIKIMRLEELS